MIFGRPTNLWLGLIGAFIAFLQVAIVNLVPNVDATAVATVLGALGLLLGAAVGLIANQPASIAEGASYTVVTTGDAPNVQKVANRNATPPALQVPKT